MKEEYLASPAQCHLSKEDIKSLQALSKRDASILPAVPRAERLCKVIA